MQHKQCKQADRKMSRRYAFLMRIFVVSVFINSYFLVKFVLMHLSQESEDNNHVIQKLVKEKLSILLDDPIPQGTTVEESLNVEKEDLPNPITKARIQQFAKQRRSSLSDDLYLLRGNIEEDVNVKKSTIHKQKPLYQKETQALEATFRKQVASFYEKYNKIYKPYTMDDVDYKENNQQHNKRKNDGSQSLAIGIYHDRELRTTKRKKKGKIKKISYEEIPIISSKDLCQTPSDLLIVVNSSPQKIKQRLAIRYSWAEKNSRKRNSFSDTTTQRMNSQVLFAIGTQAVDSQAGTMLKAELEEYKDMILLDDIVDKYQNLASKTMKVLEWISENCESYFVMKTDDDCFVNKHNLLDFLQRQGIEDDLYAGRVQWSMPAIRERDSKFFVPKSVHPSFLLHPYASGGGYVVSWNLLKGMVSRSKQLSTIPIEDANVGNVLHSMGVRPLDIRDFLPFIYCNTTSVWDRPPCDYVRPYVIHGIDPYGQLWMHYHVTVLTTVQSICKQENKHRYKFNPPYYCPVDLSM